MKEIALPIHQQIKNKLDEIHSILSREQDASKSLFSGSGGHLLFHYHFTKIHLTESNQSQLEQRVIAFLEGYSENQSSTFCNGLPGNIWLIQYLIDQDLLDNLMVDIKDEIADYLLNHGANHNHLGCFDFLHGSLGLLYTSVYCKDQIPVPVQNELIKPILSAIQQNERGSYFSDWMKEVKDDFNSKAINLGLAHGIPSAAMVLSKVDSPEVKPVVIELMKFIRSFRSNSEDTLAFYPNTVNLTQDYFHESRLAWCYGDPGIAAVFWQLGKLYNNKSWKDEALEIMLRCAKRRDLEENTIVDGGICHGTAGMAHFFNRFYKETGIQEFDDARWYWLSETLKMARFEDGIAGYKVRQGKSEWKTETGLLEGIAGIGLVMLGFLTDDINDLDWDNCLLLS